MLSNLQLTIIFKTKFLFIPMIYFYQICFVGFLFDANTYYPSSFYFGGAVTIFGALLMIPLAIRELKAKK